MVYKLDDCLSANGTHQLVRKTGLLLTKLDLMWSYVLGDPIEFSPITSEIWTALISDSSLFAMYPWCGKSRNDL